MYKNFVKVITVVIVFGGMLSVGDGAKALDCCSISRGYKGSVMNTVDCRLEGNFPCVEQLSCVFEGCVLNDGTLAQTEKRVDCKILNICKQRIIEQTKACDGLDKEVCSWKPALCFFSGTLNTCLSRTDPSNCPRFGLEDCRAAKDVCIVTEDQKCTNALNAAISSEYYRPQGENEILPACALDGSCRNLSDILRVVLNAANLVFRYIGAIAFVFFIYGGFTMILSFGNSEKFKKGQQILVAAVIGLAIVFSAYLIVSFVLGALGVGGEFTAIR